MAELEERVAALEALVTDLIERFATSRPPVDATALAGDVYWALNGLKQHLPADSAGAVVYTGSVRLAEGQQHDWQYGRTVDDLLASDWTELAGTLTALGHPVRLRLLREILGGRHGTSDLAEIEGLGTTGQLHHHLRQLTAAGWLRNAGRGHYAIPPERIVPLLTVLLAAHR